MDTDKLKTLLGALTAAILGDEEEEAAEPAAQISDAAAFEAPATAPTVSSGGQEVPLSVEQRGFLAAAHAAATAPAEEVAPKPTYKRGDLVEYEGKPAIVTKVVTEVPDNKRSADGSSFEPSGETVSLSTPRYELAVLDRVVGPLEI